VGYGLAQRGTPVGRKYLTREAEDGHKVSVLSKKGDHSPFAFSASRIAMNSSGILLCLRRLHVGQAMTMFSGPLEPPLLSGMK